MGCAAKSVVVALTEALGDCNGCTATAAAHALGQVAAETESVVAALAAAQGLAERTSNPGFASACQQARDRLAYASAKSIKADVRRTQTSDFALGEACSSKVAG